MFNARYTPTDVKLQAVTCNIINKHCLIINIGLFYIQHSKNKFQSKI